MFSQIIRILFYNAIFAGIGIYLIRTFFNTQYNSYVLFLFLLGLVVFDCLIERKKLSSYGIKKPRKQDLKFALIIFALFFPISIASRVLFPNFDALYANVLGLQYSNLFKFLIFSVPIAILIEEVGTRSLFQSKLSSVFNSRFAIYAAIINFTLLHFTWAFSLDLLNFSITVSTVFIYSIFLALLFDYTKNIFSTIAVHLLVNITSSFQIMFHIYNQFSYEMILWLSWGILFIAFFPQAISFLKNAFITSKGKIKNFSEKILLFLLSAFSLIIIIFVNSFL
jgi:membrane protease YdiL (CAAX protease family)